MVRAGLREVLAQFGPIGCTGFGGPPDAHRTAAAVVRHAAVVVGRRPSSRMRSRSATSCPARLRRSSRSSARGRSPDLPAPIVGGLAFILPGLVVILGLAAIFLAAAPPTWVLGAGAGAGAAVAAVAVGAGTGLGPGELGARRRHALDGWRTRCSADSPRRRSARGWWSSSWRVALSRSVSRGSAATAGSAST